MNRPTADEIRSIYAGIMARPGLSIDFQGWNSGPEIMYQLLQQIQPSVVIEVGVWKGASLVNMASHCAAAGMNTLFYAVDVWFGHTGTMFGHAPASQIPTRWDQPTHYEQFLYNIATSGLDDRVIPVWNFTHWGAHTLKKWGVVADVIYVDAAHDEEFVYLDLVDYWPLLRSGGAMFGDDLCDAYPGVEAAVTRFCLENALSFGRHGGHWCINKP